MIGKVRSLMQIIFFMVFLLLMLTGKAQFWMAFIFLSVILAAFFGRFYCGWACPINTLIRPVNLLKKKLGIKDRTISKLLREEKPRWIVFSLFIIGLGYTIYTITQGRKFPLPLIIIPLAIVSVLAISEKAWHRYLCPWGVLFSLTARFSKYGVHQEKCKSCKLCSKSCPGDAINIDEKKGAVVDSKNCLVCFECKSTCPINSFNYKHNS